MGKKISELTAAAALAGTELLELVQGGANVKALVGALLRPGYINGLKVKYIGSAALTVGTGGAYVPSLGTVLPVNTPISLTGLALAGSTWYHLYLYSNAGVPAVEVVTTAPDDPYTGTARTKLGDSSRRYLGSIITNGSGAIIAFVHTGDDFLYPAAGTFAPFRVLSNGTAVSPTTVDLTNSIPAPAKAVHLRVFNQNNVNISLIATGFGTVSSSVYSIRVNAGLIFGAPLPLGDSKSFDYTLDSAGTGGLYVDVVGYRVER